MKHEIFRKLFVLLYSRMYRLKKRIFGRVSRPKEKQWIDLAENPQYRTLPLIGEDKAPFARIEASRIAGCSCGVRSAAKAPAGGVVRFSTDAGEITIEMVFDRILSAFDQTEMSLTGYSGIDIYVREDGEYRWKGCFPPNRCLGAKLCRKVCLSQDGSKKMREVLIYLPIMTPVGGMRIGIDKESRILAVDDRKQKTIGVYGSSITQGCAASRPGMSYVSQLGRMLDAKMLNFGFSGSAKGEEELARMIGALPLDALVIEYDHNATLEELSDTHRRFFAVIRENNPQLPVVFLSRISGGISISLEETDSRRRVIQNTIAWAKGQGDNRVSFVDGLSISEQYESGCLLSDDRHPNDLGMTVLAQQTAQKLKEALEIPSDKGKDNRKGRQDEQ